MNMLLSGYMFLRYGTIITGYKASIRKMKFIIQNKRYKNSHTAY